MSRFAIAHFDVMNGELTLEIVEEINPQRAFRKFMLECLKFDKKDFEDWFPRNELATLDLKSIKDRVADCDRWLEIKEA